MTDLSVALGLVNLAQDKNEDFEIRMEAIRSMGRHVDDFSVGLCLSNLASDKSQHPKIRLEATRAMGGPKDEYDARRT